ncbi:hypothetical protein [Flavobacterium praedii]|uniref:hypothetical protein n=1 Tax=Flavobacterium praedii TaxID=3002900 RepID=UPI002481F811|nr:hypothetical protein [Flavobacterium praedii]
MDNENIINDVKSILEQMPGINYGAHVISQLNVNSYGSGQAGFDALKNALNGMELAEAIKSADLNQKIKRQQKLIKDLEKEHINLTAIIGNANGDNEGSLAHTLLESIQKQVDELIFRRDGLIDEIKTKEAQLDKIIEDRRVKEVTLDSNYLTKKTKLEEDYKSKKESLDSDQKLKELELHLRLNNAVDEANNKIAIAESNANNKVKLINQFSDFLTETNKNMTLYSIVIWGLLIAAILAIGFSIPKLLNTFDSYDTFIKSQGIFISTWHIINYALGILIVKLPWALCLSAVLTGMYKLLKGLLVTYEKINQDKRNMSAIYAISGNVAQSLNEYGMAVAEEEVEDEVTEDKFTSIRVERKGLEQKRENLRWNQIMNYFEKMQQNKEEAVLPDDDPSKLKLTIDLLNKLIDKFPKQ